MAARISDQSIRLIVAHNPVAGIKMVLRREGLRVGMARLERAEAFPVFQPNTFNSERLGRDWLIVSGILKEVAVGVSPALVVEEVSALLVKLGVETCHHETLLVGAFPAEDSSMVSVILKNIGVPTAHRV